MSALDLCNHSALLQKQLRRCNIGLMNNMSGMQWGKGGRDHRHGGKFARSRRGASRDRQLGRIFPRPRVLSPGTMCRWSARGAGFPPCLPRAATVVSAAYDPGGQSLPVRRGLRGRRLRAGGRRPVPPAAGSLPHVRPPQRQALHGLRLLDQRQGPRPRLRLPVGPLGVN